ncbi:glycosyltransferase family 2 protein [Microbacterium sp.]|uniref:glycosyltransferase family 2 protein n=1 Tax=Microbacterium sp. TaxID=51671 RepID=UPI00333F7233
MQLSIIVPTYNEGQSAVELIRRADSALQGIDAEILFVDDGTDDLPEVVADASSWAHVSVRVRRRPAATGGLSGAVVEGLRHARSNICIVMDGDLQHPPEVLRDLWERHARGDADVVVASRYVDGGDADGLADVGRVLVSRLSTSITRAMFPVRLREVTDPMTGFFLVDTATLDLDELRPRGFKILLELLVRRQHRVAEVPFVFASRFAGESKATVRQGVQFLAQVAALRFGRMSSFAVVGAFGAAANIAIVWAMTSLGIDYLLAAIVAAEATILGNFVLFELAVFRDMRAEASTLAGRFWRSFAFNNVESAVRIPVVALLVSGVHLSSVLATALTLAVAFIARFLFHSLVVYRPRASRAPQASAPVSEAAEAITP